MQVHRLHYPEATPNPLHAKVPGEAAQVSSSKSPSASPGGGTAAGVDSTLATYVARLREIPETREAVVARAREKVAAGDYLTRPSAEATAEVFLRSV